MSRIIITRSGEFADGTIGRMLKAFQAQQELAARRQWIAEQEQRIESAKINVFIINEQATEFDKRCIPNYRKEK